jgi:hypothetical protein
MTETIQKPEEWLSREDIICRDDRLLRLRWLSENAPISKYWTFPGGLISKYLFEETRYCFVYGQFLATIVLGLSYIEHTLAGLFFVSGRNDLKRVGISTLLEEALDYNWITQEEFSNLDHARKVRNPVTHFRGPGQDDTVEYRAAIESELPYKIIEEDAKHVMVTVLNLVGKNAIS